jgi:hypothetical protein
MFWMLSAFFWVIPWHLNFICWCFRTLCLFHLHRQVDVKNSSYLPAYEDGKECSETSAYKIRVIFHTYLPRRWNRQSVPKCWHIKFRSFFTPTCLWRWNRQNVLKRRHIKFRSFFTPTCLWRWNRQSVPKRRHIKFRRWRITQKKADNMLLKFYIVYSGDTVGGEGGAFDTNRTLSKQRL